MSHFTKRNVIVVGGGAAGTTIARELSTKLDASKYDLILLTPRPFSVWLPALVRAVVTAEGGYGTLDRGSLVPYDHLFAKGIGRMKVGTLTALETDPTGLGGTVVLQDGERISYAALVLASGSTWADPLNIPDTIEETEAYLRSWQTRFRNAKHVLLVGGGAVGIEIAGELKDLYPDKPVTIVQGSTGLLNGTYPDSFRERLSNGLLARSVSVILNDYVDDIPENGDAPTGISTRFGKHIDADLVVSTRGGHPNTSYAKGAASGVELAPKGQIRVEQTLQAKGIPNVFVAGDIIDWNEQKQSAKCSSHASVVIANVLRVLDGLEANTVYSGASELIAVTNGKKDGAAYFSYPFGLQFGGWFVRLIKSDLFVGQYRKSLGY